MLFELSCGHLNIYAFVQIGDYNATQARRYARRKGYDDSVLLDLPNHAEVGAAATCWGSPDIATSFIWLPEMPCDRYTESLLVHEIVHAIDHGMEVMGSDCDELRAYLIGNFYKDAMNQIDKIGVAKPRARSNKKTP